MGTQLGRSFFSGTITADTGTNPLQPAMNGAGVYEVGISKLKTRLDVHITTGASLPTTEMIVIIYLRSRSDDTDWKKQKSIRSPSTINTTESSEVIIDNTYLDYKISVTSPGTNNCDLVIEERTWDLT